MISTSSRSGASPLSASACRIISLSAPRWNCTGETLTATRTSSGQRAAWRQASRTTHAPIGTIRPVSSAIGMKSAGETRPRVGMVPADQRLERADAVVLEVEQRLVIELELAALDREAQVGFELAALPAPAVEALLEESVGAAPGFLGAVEREVGVAQQVVGVAAVRGRDGDADAGRRRELVAVDDERLGHGLEDPAGEPVDRVAVLADGLEHDELVAAEARDEMAARRLLHALRRPRSARCRRPGGRACR